MTRKIFRSIVAVAASVLLMGLVIIMGILYEYFGNIQLTQLMNELELAAPSVEKDGVSYLKELAPERYRLTWIAQDGTVIYDTQTGTAQLENHSEREEVQEALLKGEGQSSRYSSTLLEKTRYYARTLADGTALRISADYATAGLLVLGMLQPIITVFVAALILSGILAGRLSKRIVEPLNMLDLDHPLENETYEELSPLLVRLSHQMGEISRQMQKLQEKTDEFEQITGSMKEGLVLLDRKRTVLSMNPAAQVIFGEENDAEGSNILQLYRGQSMDEAVTQAFETGHDEMRMERAGREYQVDISRIESSGSVVGAVLLVFDITEQEFAERNRREFTANVSHELKTPLQGIIGSAELIENGMVKQEDLSRFVGHIRKEASRLVVLIGDIIRLSQLDEGTELPKENVELLPLASEVLQNLQAAAKEKEVSLSLTGSSVTLYGVRRLLYEIVYNLCENAIKYNVTGGSVELHAEQNGQEAVLRVTDSGIGIAPEHQDRVFERFYRVDKSHSKASGGTGLGLSIVKHAVQYHHGTITMRSEAGKGTEIMIRFPCEA